MLIVCNGMIRSGSTLQYNIVRELVERTGAGTGEGFWKGSRIDGEWGVLRPWMDEAALRVIKTHDYVSRLVDALQEPDAGVAICYTYRDLRDVAASAKRKFDLTSRELEASLGRAIEVSRKMERISCVLRVRYESLMHSPEEMVRTHAEHLGLEVRAGVIRDVAAACALEKMEDEITGTALLRGLRRMGQRMGLPIKEYDRKTLLHPDHVSENRGRPGSWEAVLTDEEQTMVYDVGGEWLRDMGYL